MNQEEEKSLRKSILTVLATEPIYGIDGARLCPQILGEEPSEQGIKDLANCMHYLEQHKLITVQWNRRCGVPIPLLSKITASGRDYISEDGGLTAELNTVTVKFDADNIRSLVEVGLLKANLPEEKRSTLLNAIKNAPATVLQTAITKLVEVGMSDPVGSVKALAGALGINL